MKDQDSHLPQERLEQTNIFYLPGLLTTGELVVCKKISKPFKRLINDLMGTGS
jgi:hypothetical protein